MRHLIFTLFFILFLSFNSLFAQFYSPTKESVPNISRYKAYLQFETVLNKCKDNFGGTDVWVYGGWQDILPSVSPPKVTDTGFSLTLKSTYTKKIETYEFTFSTIEIPTFDCGPKKGSKLYFTYKKWRKLYLLGATYDDCRKLVDALCILKTKDQKAEDQKELEAFKPIAQQYQSLSEKPKPSEEVRKYFIQATNATEEKRYVDAIDQLEKAIAVDQTFPMLHFNRALLWGQVSMYGAAIVEMKKYLMLVPNASDARAAQDKIYEWEAKTK